MGFISLLLLAAWIMNSFKKKARMIDYENRIKELERGRFIRRFLEEGEELARYRKGDYSAHEDDRS